MGRKVAVEICIRCGRATEYDVNMPVEMRRWYVEGSGQLCEACWNKLWSGITKRELNHGIDEKKDK